MLTLWPSLSSDNGHLPSSGLSRLKTEMGDVLASLSQRVELARIGCVYLR
jgi:hypothetical protein